MSIFEYFLLKIFVITLLAACILPLIFNGCFLISFLFMYLYECLQKLTPNYNSHPTITHKTNTLYQSKIEKTALFFKARVNLSGKDPYPVGFKEPLKHNLLFVNLFYEVHFRNFQ